MSRITIDYGIDLGTTNSVVAHLDGMNRTIIKNNEGRDCTPSVVWIDNKDRIHVGDAAKVRQDEDPDNVAYEFKRVMGKDKEFNFLRSNRKMRPEELSAEILKSLRQSVEKRDPDPLAGAVITVPAAFEVPQIEATKKSAQLAGFQHYPLLQEPVAAALSYGFESDSENEYWLVYDLGGGTFDAAVINMRDGIFNVVNHLGDNDLGGQLLDWSIVNEILIPEITRKFKLTDFRKGNHKYDAAFAKLKAATEEAKIRLSGGMESVDIWRQNLCADDQGNMIELDVEIKQSDVERLMEPIIRRTISKCRKVLEEKRLGPANIQKILLVGGPTQMPYLRERLADSQEGLGIPLSFERDPLTVVAEGAAIFAGTQRITSTETFTPRSGYSLQLEYEPIGFDPEPEIAGRVLTSKEENFDGFTVEFTNSSVKPIWSSGKSGLTPEGIFSTELWAEKGIENIFEINLFDRQGNKIETTPSKISYRLGAGISEIPLTHSVGVALADNEMEWFGKKGDPLPIRQRRILKSARHIHKGESGDLLRIPFMEGESNRADRNTRLGMLGIPATDIPRDLPAGQEVEILIEIDKTGVQATAYIPILGEMEFDVKLDYEQYKKNALDPDMLRDDLDREKQRLDTMQQQVDSTGDENARLVIQCIYKDCMVQEVEDALGEAGSGQSESALGRCHSRLQELMVALDNVEDALQWPLLVTEAEKEINIENDLLDNPDLSPTSDERQAIYRLSDEIRSAIRAHDIDLLRHNIRELDRIGIMIVMRSSGWWVEQYHQMEERNHSFTDTTSADAYLQRSRQAIQDNDVEGLKSSVRQLWSLLPSDDPDRNRFSDVMR